ncbi:DEAD/DEAH box helicase [Pseudomonas aeruginosa]|uniref:DEAD/DEAH box helicase n=1 Tax=Pseudomonas aeruginosa TaxID=287 RepID=UPI001F4AA7A4|nr:ATP-binding domain-containing protein [Pseudomonas aeruginosa]HEH8686918.1 DEAD/DEAH box helicase [Pseudomonas aeruginosa]
MAETFYFLSGSLALENKPFHFRVAEVIKRVFSKCHGYVGYKLTTLGRASDADVPSFILVTKEFGIILVDVVEDRLVDVLESEGAEYWKLESGELLPSRVFTLEIYEDEVASRLKNDPNLYDRKSKSIKVPVRSFVVFCTNSSEQISAFVNSDETAVEGISFDALEQSLNGVELSYNSSDEEIGRVCSLIEGTFIYETKRAIIEDERLETVNDYIQKSLRTTFKQDESQRLAAMQLPPGPQRIRGLAGTGKTIVLCLKAAITHKRFKDYKILYLFNTQSLYQHVQNLITKYYTLEAKRTPDFDSKLNVFHAWGGRQKPGLYSTLCQSLGITPLTLADARGKGDSLKFIYKDLLERAGNLLVPEYDLVLIDEAQDFPNEVFEVAYRITKGEGAAKRIIWAYDEFQSLRDTVIKGPSELFGVDGNGHPNLPDSILNGRYEGDIPKDFVLPNCYRTPRPVLMTAHGIAMGLYSSRQSEMFYHSAEWNAIGYSVVEPQGLLISEGDKVEIERPDANSKNLLEGILRDNGKRPLNLVRAERFDSDQQQLKYLAEKIQRLIMENGVAPEEIIVINLSPGNNKNSMLAIQRELVGVGVKSVIPGYVESADVFKPSGFVTLTTPFRAKGNEANIVFVVNAQRVSDDFTLRMRNAFFVAVTRSRGWCYITGYGAAMQGLVEEIESIKRDFPMFKFICPSPSRVKNTKSFLDKSDKELDKIQEFMELLRANPELRDLILDQERGAK